MNSLKVIFLFSLTFYIACDAGNNDQMSNDINNFDATISDMGISDTGSDIEVDGADSSPDLACLNVRGYTIDLSIPCKQFEKPDREFGCLPCSSPVCSGLAQAGCYLSPDQSTVIFSETISAPYDSFIDMGWNFCFEKTSDGEDLVLEDLPTCE